MRVAEHCPNLELFQLMFGQMGKGDGGVQSGSVNGGVQDGVNDGGALGRMLQRCTRLRELRLIRVRGVDDRLLVGAWSREPLAPIRTLALMQPDHQITDRWLDCMLEYPGFCARLEHLDLDYSDVTDRTVLRLLGGTTTTTIGTTIGTMTSTTIPRCPRLRTLDLSYCTRITANILVPILMQQQQPCSSQQQQQHPDQQHHDQQHHKKHLHQHHHSGQHHQKQPRPRPGPALCTLNLHGCTGVEVEQVRWWMQTLCKDRSPGTMIIGSGFFFG